MKMGKMAQVVFEKVYAYWDWHDGPLLGVADFCGQPHVFLREFNEELDEYARFYRLAPLPPDALPLVEEAWTIWTRWLRANRAGLTGIETHPALPEDSVRHDVLHEQLRIYERAAASSSVVRDAEFQALEDKGFSSGERAFEVMWLAARDDMPLHS